MNIRVVSVPAEFPGTEGEKAENFRTHSFSWQDARCYECDCRPWGRVADWPCGVQVPRVLIEDAF